MRWLLLFLLILPDISNGQEWDAYNFPNPTAGQFKECKMRTSANICDPDEVLSEQARYRLDHDLKQLESRTRQDYGRTFCDKKGVTAAMAIARHVKGGTTEAVETMANDMLRKWTLDSQCKKAVVIVVSTDDMKFWVARDDKVPVYADEFTQIFMSQKSLFQQGNYQQALSNILQQTWEKSLSKQGSPRQPPSRGSGPQGPQGPQGGFGGGGRPGSAFKMPSIPSWFWLFLIGVVIPLLCCCCCIYCCCCRGKSSGGAGQRVPTDPAMGEGGGGGGGAPRSGGRGLFGNFLSTASGAGVGSMLGRLLSGGNRGGGGGGAGGFGMGGMGGGGGGGGNRGYGYSGGGGAYPDAPVYDDNGGQGGGGLYPSRDVKDRGGGGSWA